MLVIALAAGGHYPSELSVGLTLTFQHPPEWVNFHGLPNITADMTLATGGLPDMLWLYSVLG